MDDRDFEQLTDEEIKKRLRDEPFLVRRMATVAQNAGVLHHFMEHIELGLDPKQLHGVITQSLSDAGIKDPEDILNLFEVRMYD